MLKPQIGQSKESLGAKPRKIKLCKDGTETSENNTVAI